MHSDKRNDNFNSKTTLITYLRFIQFQKLNDMSTGDDCILGFEHLHNTVLNITGNKWSVTVHFKGLTKQKANVSGHFDQSNCLLYIQIVPCFTNFM